MCHKCLVTDKKDYTGEHLEVDSSSSTFGEDYIDDDYEYVPAPGVSTQEKIAVIAVVVLLGLVWWMS